MKTAVLITGLVLLLVANLIMVYYSPYGLSPREGFQVAAPPTNAPMSVMNTAAPSMMPEMPSTAAAEAPSAMPNSNVPSSNAAPASMPASSVGGDIPANASAAPAPSPMPMANNSANNSANNNATEGFASYFLSSAGGAKDVYQPIGSFDGVRLKTGNSVSSWRYTAPNEPLTGPPFEPGPDSLFMFKSNQCKPECCGASFSCGGGCVCTTPQQRQYIATRGGNRTAPEDSA